MSWTRTPLADELKAAKSEMLLRNLKGRDIQDPRTLAAMESVPRERFVLPDDIHSAYNDSPLPIGYGQTISQPYIVALTAQALQISPEDKVLEIGAGCGYQAAVLSLLGKHVYTIEIIPQLVSSTQARLADLGYDNVTVIAADGTHGYSKQAPYQKIAVAATARKAPPELEEQLAEGGRICMPLGDNLMQELVLGEKRGGVVKYRTLTFVRFVPMTGDARMIR
ncbi:MAG: protein-L-isoaspartate(D-aspartate) O-methyltransferase [Nitrospinota bacterium]|nr:protein-L-isoaspartate(D-aspartate) O-methyltransferase [Nitrospinota bacterium]